MNIKEIKGSTIFAVDDNKENLKVLVQYLSDFELKIVPLRSGEELLNLISKRIPDMILLDIMMPGGIDGYETCRRLKADETAKDIPVIFMSALTDTFDKVAGFSLGAVDYITKPIETEELLSRIHTHLSISRLQKELVKMNAQLEEKVLVRTEDLRKSNIQLRDEIAARKQAEEEIRKLSLAVKQSPASIVITDLSGNIEYVNPKFIEITGYSFAEVQGKNPRVLNTGETSAEEYKKLWDTISSGKVWRGEFYNKKKNGELYWESAIISPIKDSKNEITHYLAVKEDITEIKQLQQQLFQSQKMESIGTLAGGVAHDFNNILTVINGYSELLLDQLNAADPIRKKLEQINKAGERAHTLTTQLLAFSRRQVIQPRVINLNSIISDIVKMLRRLIGEDIELETVLDEKLANIKADKGQMDQVIMNLAVNARDAMPDTGKLTIETSNIDIDEGHTKHPYSVQPGFYVMLAVSDTGCGMDKKTQSKIFEPFYTTKEQGKGTGLGLSTVYGIVKQNEGYIRVYSEPGQGTTFKIYFPFVDKTAQTEKGVLFSAESLEGSEVILVVEDDSSVRELFREFLTRYGYKILMARDGEDALSICKMHKTPIHLIITDVIMPNMGGRKLEKNISRLYPKIKVLFVSGYTDKSIMHHGVLEEGVAFLGKPFGPVSLVQKVREVLDSSQNREEEDK